MRLMIKLLQHRKADTHSRTALPRYDQYIYSPFEWGITVLIGALLFGLIAVVFYKHAAAVFLFGCAGLLMPQLRRKGRIEHRQAQLKLQFKQLLAALSSALSAGKSLESAFAESLADLQLLYPDSGTMIIVELETINRKLEIGEPLEKALMNFAERAGIDEIYQLAEVIYVCKRSGGNLIQVVRRTASIIQDKLDMQQEIRSLLAQKSFEAKVLTAAPVVMIGVLAFTSPDYMEPLYNQASGVMMMSGALLVFGLSFWFIRKLMVVRL